MMSCESLSDLYKACRDGDEDLVKGLLASMDYKDVNRLESNGSTALHAAVCSSHASIVRMLLNFPVDRYQRNCNGLTAYEEAKTDTIRELFRGTNGSSSRFCSEDCLPFSFVNETVSRETNDQPLPTWFKQLDTDEQIARSRNMLSLGKYLWSSEWGQKFYSMPCRVNNVPSTLNMDNFVLRFEQLIDEIFPQNSPYRSQVLALWNEHKQTRRPEPLLTIYTLETPFYREMTNNEDKGCTYVFLIWRHLNALAPRFFHGTLYRGVNMTADDLRQYQRAFEKNHRLIANYKFCSTSVKREVAEKFANNSSSSCIRTMMVLNFDRPYNGAIRLYAISDRLPCISRFSEEQEVLILPGTLFRICKIERDERNNSCVIYLNHVPESENPLLLCAKDIASEAFKTIKNFFSPFS